MLFPNANICLTFEPDVQENFVNLAQDFFGKFADGYLLAENVFPHLTLCQLYLETKEQRNQIAHKIRAMPSSLTEIQLTGFHYRYAGDFFWCEFIADKNSDLQNKLKSVEKLLNDARLRPINKVGSKYHPHVTLARIRSNTPFPKIYIPDYFFNTSFQTNLTFGISDENGQLLSLSMT